MSLWSHDGGLLCRSEKHGTIRAALPHLQVAPERTEKGRWAMSAKTCGDCRHFDDGEERCYRNPPVPTLVTYINERKGYTEREIEGLRPPVSRHDRACGEFAPKDGGR